MNRLICVVIALIYATLLAAIPMAGVIDRDNYLDMARVSPILIARNISNGILAVFTNEPVWLGLNSVLSFVLEPDIIVRLIIFFSAFTVAYLVLRHRKENVLLLLLFLLMPLVVKNFIIHLRQGLAIAFFMLGWFATSNKKKWLFLGLTPFIHSSFFLVLPLIVVGRLLLKLRFALDIRIIAYVVCGITVGVGVGVIAAALGARQANTTVNMEAGISGVGFVLWSLIAVLFFLQGKKFAKSYVAEFGILIFYLATYFLTPITGRVFESGVLIVLLAGLQLTGYRKYGFVLIILLFTTLYYLMRMQQPLLGYGAT